MSVKRNAFTLIELLVVIAIIGLLLAVILPALNKVKDSAMTLICGTNLKNYGTALQGYAADNKGRAPFMISWLYSQQTINRGELTGNIPRHCRWHENSEEADGSLWSYLSDKNVHMCPTFQKHAKRVGLGGCPNVSQHNRNTRFVSNYSYSMNYFVGFDWHKYMELGRQGLDAGRIMYDNEHSMLLSKVTRPAKCFAFSEENLWTISASEWDGGSGIKTYSSVLLNDNALWVNAIKSTQGTAATDNIATYHKVPQGRINDGQANLVYVDGHVETRRGRPGREAYEDYGIPFSGHDSVNIW